MSKAKIPKQSTIFSRLFKNGNNSDVNKITAYILPEICPPGVVSSC
jgi:hypothetical protein